MVLLELTLFTSSGAFAERQCSLGVCIARWPQLFCSSVFRPPNCLYRHYSGDDDVPLDKTPSTYAMVNVFMMHSRRGGRSIHPGSSTRASTKLSITPLLRLSVPMPPSRFVVGAEEERHAPRCAIRTLDGHVGAGRAGVNTIFVYSLPGRSLAFPLDFLARFPRSRQRSASSGSTTYLQRPTSHDARQMVLRLLVW